jgi:hypothetical protein
LSFIPKVSVASLLFLFVYRFGANQWQEDVIDKLRNDRAGNGFQGHHDIVPQQINRQRRKLSMKVEMQWGLDDSKQVSALDPRVEFVDEFSLLDGRYDQFPEPIRQKLSPA